MVFLIQARKVSGPCPQVLVKRCGPITALDDVSLMVREGEILGFPGISGAGKTTMIRLLIAVL